MYKDLQPASLNEEFIVRPANTMADVREAFELFNQSFDKYSGDYVPSEDYEGLLSCGSILLARRKDEDGSKFLGALHYTVYGNVAWVSHLAVKESARGQHVGQALLDAFVERNMVTEKSRYMLWVQHQNEAAVKMYENKGFKYLGKSSLSMITL
jgi:ribosomal protein S18 acetylase RimI-like enzyme